MDNCDPVNVLKIPHKIDIKFSKRFVEHEADIYYI